MFRLAVLTLISIATLAPTPAAWAQEGPYRSLGLGVTIGQTQVVGDAGTQSPTFYELGVQFHSPNQSGFFDFEFGSVGFNNEGRAFPFPTGRKITVDSTTFMPNVRVYSIDRVDFFLGAGFALLRLSTADSSGDYEQSYGSFAFRGLIRYAASERVTVGFKTNWTNIEQKNANNRSFMEFWNNGIVVAYLF